MAVKMDGDTEKTPLHPAPYVPPPINDDLVDETDKYLQPITSSTSDVKDFYTFHFRGGRVVTVS